jgi:dTDP-4-amino-4,6-dideoxygalactose transaminase
MSSAIPWASPLAQYRAHQVSIQSAINRVLESGDYILGEEVASFERAFAAYCGVEHAVGVGSGTDALILALRALGIGPGDEVITVSHTAVATVAAVLATGATPVLVDVDSVSYTIDPARIAEAITPRTRAIIPVHLYGRPADMTAIAAIAEQHELRVIEDCAQAAGALHRGRRVGSCGDLAAFSFYPTKNLGGVGDGGMVITNDNDLASRVRRLRQYGWDQSRNTHEIGLNSRLDPLQAAVLHAKLPQLTTENARRAAIAHCYNDALADLPLATPAVTAEDTHVYHLYVVRCTDRARLRAHLGADQIGSAVHYPVPVHRQAGYAEKIVIAKGGLPVTDRLCGEVLSLPIYPELNGDAVDRIVGSMRRCLRQIVPQ